MLNIGLLLWFFKYTSAKCEKVPIICAFFSSSKLSPSEEWPALQVVMVGEVDKNYTAPKWVPIWGPGSPWRPFSDFGSPKGPLSRSPFSPFQAEECAKSQSSHYLLNVDHLNTCDDQTMKMAQTCAPNEATLCEGVFP